MILNRIDVSAVKSIPVPRDLTRDEEAAVIAQYKAERTLDELEADYCDFDKQVAEGVPAEQFLNELGGKSFGKKQ